MKLKSLKIKGFKNLTGTDGWFTLDFTNKDGITVLIGNNGSGKSNVLEAISSIFIGLYKISSPNRKPTFSYIIEYSMGEEPSTDIKIELIDGTYGFYINNIKELKKDFLEWGDRWLPSKVIASYSGEELRLWDTYYKYSYSDFITSVKSNELRSLPEQKLFYIDSDYWNAALIVFLLSELASNQNFVLDNLGIVSVENIVFKFNTNNLSKYQSNMITEFVRRLNPDNNDTITKSFEDFKDFVTEYEYELFIKLISASQSELISNIIINFNRNLTTEDLSEGQKKQILIRAILEFLADRETLVLLDEPDSHIHVANKLQLKNMLEEYEYKNLIFTSHSPTLMNIFDRHLEYLENGQIKGSEKAEILKEISGDTMSDAQRQILLNANTDILIVEGKTDEKYISTALEKLKQANSQYEDLEFNYLYMGGSDPENLKKLVEQFPPKDNQTIIAFFDNDGAGYNCITKAFNCRTQKQDFTRANENGVHICLYPKKDDFVKSDFEIEDYFKIETCRDFMFSSFETFQDTKKKFKKDDFAEYCPNLGADEFDGFKKLFDLILEIKGL
ncbi:ATP-dependent nuclease [Aliarcobacter butzleri]|uniref:ATP-dependent nuclease n=1 Tax=Aliarcobacter butzleri TaxID=28197 RepID=UPI0012607ED8|nr:ATP-binding protein [Aliarcobacter butzleri]